MSISDDGFSLGKFLEPGLANVTAAWRNVTTASLLEELRRRDVDSSKPVCGSGKAKGKYDTAIHVFALFLILALSFLGLCSAKNRLMN